VTVKLRLLALPLLLTDLEREALTARARALGYTSMLRQTKHF